MSILGTKEETLKGKKSLVIYFSHTGENYMSDGIRNIDKGNTEIVAETIRDITGADLFKVETVKEYPYNYKECCDVAKEELKTGERPKLKRYLNDISEYEVIYLCSPIWWNYMPNAMLSQLEKLDFTGKIVKYVITHEGSGIGNCYKNVEKYCNGADIRKGLAIRGSFVNNAKETIAEWI